MKNKELNDIRIRDPFILKNKETYYLYGSTDANTWSGKGTGFDFYKSKDLKAFEGPYAAFRPREDFWADENFWAPEVWKYNGMFYMIATFKKKDICRGVQILSASSPEGPFEPITNKAITPSNWECLDGTLHFENGKIYLIFCHEWRQIGDGAMCVVELTDDLTKTVGEPQVLFHASDAAWTIEHDEFDSQGFVTDGPFVYPNGDGSLNMIWSSFGKDGYAIGLSYTTGSIFGSWHHVSEPLYGKDGGHGMIFQGKEGELYLTFHSPNEFSKERARFVPIKLKKGLFQV